MRIAIIHYAEPVSKDRGFVLTRYAAVAETLISDGHQVTRYFPSFNHRSRQSRNFGSYEDQYGKHVVIQTPEYKGSRGFARLKFLSTFENKVLVDEQLNEQDIFIVGCPMPGIATALRKKFPDAIIVTDLRDFWPDVQVSSAKGLKKYIFRFLGRSFSKKTISDISSSSYTVTLSKSYSDRIKEKCNINYEPLVIPLGSARSGIDEVGQNEVFEKSGVIFVGSLSKLFDFNRLLNIWKIVCRKSPELARNNPLKIVGHGSESSIVQSRAEKMDFIEVTGFIPQKEALQLMRYSKLAIAIYNQMELHTLPNKLFEYSAAGLPIISNWSGDVQDATREYNFTFGDTSSSDEELADSLIRLLESATILADAIKGAEQFSKDYSRSKLAEKFKNLISTLATQ